MDTEQLSLTIIGVAGFLTIALIAIKYFNSRTRQMEDEIIRLKGKASVLERHNKIMCDNHSKDIDNKDAEIAKRGATIRNLNKEIEKLTDRVKHLEYIKETHLNYQDYKEKSLSAIARYQEENNALKNEIERLNNRPNEHDLEAEMKYKKMYEADKKALHLKYNRLQVKVETQGKDAIHQRRIINEQSTDLKRKKIFIDEQAKVLKYQTGEIAELKREKSNLISEIEYLADEIMQLNQALGRIEKKVKSIN